jgi:hypothetical protein
MKIKFFIAAAGIILLSGLSACHVHRGNDHNLSVSVKESDDEYQFSASFDEDRTRKVQNFISSYTKGKAAFRRGSNVEIDVPTTLDDNGQVYIRCHAGRIKIKFDRDDNSELAYQHAKEMCEGIKDILTEDNTK